MLLDFPGGPVVMTLCFHYRGHGFNPWLGKFVMARGTNKQTKNKELKTQKTMLLVSSVQQSDSVSYIYVYVYTYTYTFFSESSLGREIKLGVLD